MVLFKLYKTEFNNYYFSSNFVFLKEANSTTRAQVPDLSLEVAPPHCHYFLSILIF
jgi:hypothetical protein